LYVLYVLASDHGTGAGRALMDAVIDPPESVVLWVADPNPHDPRAGLPQLGPAHPVSKGSASTS
jgi:hypothetical protein